MLIVNLLVFGHDPKRSQQEHEKLYPDSGQRCSLPNQGLIDLNMQPDIELVALVLW